jgi:hypothetical protein
MDCKASYPYPWLASIRWSIDTALDDARLLDERTGQPRPLTIDEWNRKIWLPTVDGRLCVSAPLAGFLHPFAANCWQPLSIPSISRGHSNVATLLASTQRFLQRHVNASDLQTAAWLAEQGVGGQHELVLDQELRHAICRSWRCRDSKKTAEVTALPRRVELLGQRTVWQGLEWRGSGDQRWMSHVLCAS